MPTPYLDSILSQWDADSQIDKSHIDDAAVKVSQLHAKYLRMYANNQQLLRGKEVALEEVRKLKKLHLEGKLSKQEMDDLGWPYDPLNGKKIMKSDLGQWIDTDIEVQAVRALVGEYSSAKEILREILGQINWRSNNLKVMLDARKFEAGF